MIFAFLLAASQAQVLAVLEFRDKVPAEQRIDAAYLSDQVRTAAKELMPSAKVITRENMLTLLSASGKDLASCEGECEVDTGRRIGADLVVSGELLRFGTQYKLNMKLHDTRSGELLSGAVASGATADELDKALRPAVEKLLAPVRPETRQDALSDRRAAAREAEQAERKPGREPELPTAMASIWATFGFREQSVAVVATSSTSYSDGFTWGMGGQLVFRIGGPVYVGAVIDDAISGPAGLMAGGELRVAIGSVALSGGFGYSKPSNPDAGGLGAIAGVDFRITHSFSLRLQGRWGRATATVVADTGAGTAAFETKNTVLSGGGGLSLNF